MPLNAGLRGTQLRRTATRFVSPCTFFAEGVGVAEPAKQPTSLPPPTPG